MSEEKRKEQVDQVKGSVKEGLGKLTGDIETEYEGKAEKGTGKAKEVFEDIKDGARGAVEGVNEALDGDKKRK